MMEPELHHNRCMELAVFQESDIEDEEGELDWEVELFTDHLPISKDRTLPCPLS